MRYTATVFGNHLQDDLIVVESNNYEKIVMMITLYLTARYSREGVVQNTVRLTDNMTLVEYSVNGVVLAEIEVRQD